MKPIHLDPKEVIFSELEEIDYVIFVQEGVVGIGYEINKMQRFPVHLSAPSIFGGVECSYHMRSQFLVKTITSLHGYFLTKTNWKILYHNHT